MIVPFVSDLTLFLMSCGNTSGEATMSFESLSPLLLSGIDLTLVQLISVGKLAERTYYQQVKFSATLPPNELLFELCYNGSRANATFP